ncbi:MAG: FAD binding domain-containing protein, partial [bacterium]
LVGIKINSGQGLRIGALVTCGELIADPAVSDKFPYLTEAALDLGSQQVRNRATVVGNLANGSPCADMARALLCAEAEALISSSSGKRTLPLAELFTGVKETSMASNEILEAVRVPAEMAGRPGGNKKLKRIKGHDLSLASVTMIEKDQSFNISIGSCAPTPLLLPDIDSNIDEEELLQKVEETISPIDDQRASKEYRTFMVKTYVSRLKDELD